VRHVSPRFRQSAADQLSFSLIERYSPSQRSVLLTRDLNDLFGSRIRNAKRFYVCCRSADTQVPIFDDVTMRAEDRLLYDVAQFAYVAWPTMIEDGTQSALGETQMRPSVATRVQFQEVVGEKLGISVALPERGRVDLKPAEPIVKIGPKSARANKLLKRPVRCGDESHVTNPIAQSTHPADGLVFEKLEKL
jgi:hypothetical protein